MTRFIWGLLLLGCSSNEYSDDGALKIRWAPPSGVKLESENTTGSITTSVFSGGVEIRSVDAPPPAVEGDLNALREKLIAASSAPIKGTVRRERTGTLTTGPVVRWELESGAERSLLYFVPGKDRYLVMSLVASKAFDHKSDKFELSLASLRFK